MSAESPQVTALARYLFALVISNWVLADARKQQRRLCYDYDSFLFFVWPIVGLAYLFQTRGWRAFLTIFWFLLICIIPQAITEVIRAGVE